MRGAGGTSLLGGTPMDRRHFLAGTAAGTLLLAAKGLAFAQEAGAPDLGQFPRRETVIAF